MVEDTPKHSSSLESHFPTTDKYICFAANRILRMFASWHIHDAWLNIVSPEYLAVTRANMPTINPRNHFVVTCQVSVDRCSIIADQGGFKTPSTRHRLRLEQGCASRTQSVWSGSSAALSLHKITSERSDCAVYQSLICSVTHPVRSSVTPNKARHLGVPFNVHIPCRHDKHQYEVWHA